MERERKMREKGREREMGGGEMEERRKRRGN